MQDKTEPGRHAVTRIKFSELKVDKEMKNGASRVLHPALMFRGGNHVPLW